ncbi:hypothetical protein SUGI_1064400 [Cryptomeria japonica]|nr:hypothetical protein SUGI_1064400 [Cryptomeria japonica]
MEGIFSSGRTVGWERNPFLLPPPLEGSKMLPKAYLEKGSVIISATTFGGPWRTVALIIPSSSLLLESSRRFWPVHSSLFFLGKIDSFGSGTLLETSLSELPTPAC